LGGIMGQWAPYPLVSIYVPTLLLGALALYALGLLALPESARPSGGPPLQWRDALPRLTWPERSDSTAFVLTACLPFLAFGVFGLYASMAPRFLHKLVPWHGPVVSGTAIAIILFASTYVQILARRVDTQWCGFGGLISLAVSNALLMVNLQTGSAVLFGLGVALTAIGHGMSMLAGMSMVYRIARPDNRSGLLSTYLLVGYIGSMVPMMAIGWMADHWGMNVAVSSFCVAVILMGTTVSILFQRHPRMQPPRN